MLNWSDTIYSNIGCHPPKKMKIDIFFHDSDLTAVLKTLAMFFKLLCVTFQILDNVFGINQPSGRTQLKSHYITKHKLLPSKTPKSDILGMKTDFNFFKIIMMFLKILLRVIEVLCKVLILINQMAAINLIDTIYPNFVYPSQNHRKSTFYQRKVDWMYFSLQSCFWNFCLEFVTS